MLVLCRLWSGRVGGPGCLGSCSAKPGDISVPELWHQNVGTNGDCPTVRAEAGEYAHVLLLLRCDLVGLLDLIQAVEGEC